MSLLCRLGIHKKRTQYNFRGSFAQNGESTVIVSCRRCPMILDAHIRKWDERAGEYK